jgi:hypothetical protein
MAFSRKLRNEQVPAGRKSRPFINSDRIVRWIAVPGIGVALAAWSVATLSSIYDAGASIASPSSLSRGLLAPAALSFARPLEHEKRNFRAWVPADTQAEKPIVGAGKTVRLASLSAPPEKPLAPLVRESADDRFQSVIDKAALSHKKLAAAFAQAGLRYAPADGSVKMASVEIPTVERFYHMTSEGIAMPDENGPEPSRFGPRVADMERSSRLALALARAAQFEVEIVPDDGAQVASLEPGDGIGDSVFEDFPEDVPLPARRPRYEPSEPQAKRRDEDAKPSRQASQPEETQPSKPAKPTKRSGEMLAYARPDTDDDSGGGFGGVFKNLFTSRPSAGAGVAVYDIAAATVTLPDGTRLEAHSGVGKMADNARYADQQMRGPTPPGTYKLSMRESLFHGVEAIRMTPIKGTKTFGRTGFLAHTELLRGRPEQSHGCVAFKDYARFLKAFKKGKVTQLVVVSGGSRSGTAVADNGRGV